MDPINKSAGEGETNNLVKYSKFDYSNPLYLRPSDSSNTSIISYRLTGSENYSVWSRAMVVALKGKNKLGFVLGTQECPDPSLSEDWDRCNAVVLSWIFNFVEKNLFVGLVFSDKASEVWSDLSITYSKIDCSRKFTLFQEVGKITQGSDTVTDYYTKLKLIWDEYAALCALPAIPPNMEIFSMYGVGIPIESAYVYKFSPAAEYYIPFQIETSVEGGDEGPCLKGGVHSVDGEETVPVLSAGFMCAKGRCGQTRFNPSGLSIFLREYSHAPPATLLECRGTQSGAHVDIIGNFALIEDIIRVAAGSTGEEIGGDQVHCGIFKWSEKSKLKL